MGVSSFWRRYFEDLGLKSMGTPVLQNGHNSTFNIISAHASAETSLGQEVRLVPQLHKSSTKHSLPITISRFIIRAFFFFFFVFIDVVIRELIASLYTVTDESADLCLGPSSVCLCICVVKTHLSQALCCNMTQDSKHTDRYSFDECTTSSTYSFLAAVSHFLILRINPFSLYVHSACLSQCYGTFNLSAKLQN